MNPEGQMKLEDSVKLIGLCNDMCPEFERVRRIAQKDYKRPECVCVPRSSGDSTLTCIRHQRPNISATMTECRTKREW